MEDIERELLNAVVNCYNACHGTFEETVKMISDARNLDTEYTKRVLEKIRDKYSDTDEYKRLRGEVPEDFIA